MPQSKRRTTRKPKPKPKTPKEEAAQQQPDGVVVAIRPDGKGGENFGFQTLGKTTERELPTILRQGATIAEKQLGIE